MPARSVAEIQADLVEARAALSKLRTRGQSEGFDGASVGRVSLADIREDIAALEKELRFARGNGCLSTTPTIGTAT